MRIRCELYINDTLNDDVFRKEFFLNTMGVALSTIALKVDFLGIHNYDSYKK